MPKAELPELVVADVEAWRGWLHEHPDSAGVWLALAKKGFSDPTALRYDEALDEALCHGWIDGQLRSNSAATYWQRFTPRTARSPWSARNVGLVERLLAQGRMQSPGLAAVEAARADGRWDTAYAGSATIEVPADFAAAIAAVPLAQVGWDTLTRTNRYALLWRLGQIKRAETRAGRIEDYVGMLARGETIHPQGSKRSGD